MKNTLSKFDNEEIYNAKFTKIVTNRLDKYLQTVCPNDKFSTVDTPLDDQIMARLQLMDNICCTNYFDYRLIFEHCLQRGIERIFDIGGGNGFAQFVIDCEHLPLEYIVVDTTEPSETFAPQINRNYPFKIASTSRDALISHLCLGMIYTPKKHLEMFNRAIQDFDHIILQSNAATAALLQKNYPYSVIYDKTNYPICYFDTSSHELLAQPTRSDDTPLHQQCRE